MRKILALFLVVIVGAPLCATPAAADCWDWSIDETTLAVTLKSHTPDTVESVTVPDWYYPSNQSTRDTIQAAVDILKVNSMFGATGSMAVVNVFESTGGLPVSAIGDRVFEHYTNLAQVTLPESVTSIGEYAFWHCYALESFVVPQGVTSINEATFASCVGLRDITLPSGLTSIGTSAFESCTAMETVDIPDAVTEIGYAAFSGCAAMQNLTLPVSLQLIGDYAFYECDSLEWVNISDSVTYIGGSAFYGCDPVIWSTNGYVIDYAIDHGLRINTN
jgi:hypothetical protein